MTTPQLAPGVRVTERLPGGPIIGVGTNTAAFVGAALQGEPGMPELVTNWDAFLRTFGDGGPIPGPCRWFARAVFGFFGNGGTAAYILRVSSGARSSLPLPSRQNVPAPEPALLITARREGTAGDALRVAVADASLLADRLTAAGAAGPTLAVVTPRTTVIAVTDGRRLLTVASSEGFGGGDRLEVVKPGLPTRTVTVGDVEGSGLLRLTAAVGTAQQDYTGATLRITAVPAGARELLLDVPAGFRLPDGVPAGAVVRITAVGGVDEPNVVLAAGARTLTLAQPISTRLDVTANPAPALATLEFHLQITGGSPTPEVFRFLSTTPGHPRYWGDAVTSQNVLLAEPSAPPAGVTDPRPSVTAQPQPLRDGGNDDPDAAWSTIVSDPGVLDPLTRLDDVSLVCVPGLTNTAAQQALIEHCEAAGNRFAILDPPPRRDVQAMLEHRNGLRSTNGYGALYYPNILVRNVLTGRNDPQPPSGHVAGLYARSDEEFGVHKAPANEGVRGAVGLELPLTDNDQVPLNEHGINAIRNFRGGPPVVWGARTLADNRSYQYVNVRRLLIFVRESLRVSLGPVVFAPNDRQLWKRLDRTIRGFLTRVWRDGALFGATADEAFTVQIDDANNSEEDRRNGILRIWIFVRPTYPAEHVLVEVGLLVDEAQR